MNGIDSSCHRISRQARTATTHREAGRLGDDLDTLSRKRDARRYSVRYELVKVAPLAKNDAATLLLLRPTSLSDIIDCRISISKTQDVGHAADRGGPCVIDRGGPCVILRGRLHCTTEQPAYEGGRLIRGDRHDTPLILNRGSLCSSRLCTPNSSRLTIMPIISYSSQSFPSLPLISPLLVRKNWR